MPIKIIFGTRKAERDTMLVAIRGRPGLRDLPLIKQDDHFREGGLDGTWNEAFSSGDTVLCSSSDGTLLFTAGGSDAFRTWDAASTGQNLAVIETRVGRQYKTCMAVSSSASVQACWIKFGLGMGSLAYACSTLDIIRSCQIQVHPAIRGQQQLRSLVD